MRGLRALCAALLLIAFALGGPAHASAMHQHAIGAAALGDQHPQHRQDHPAKPDPDAICKLACAAAVALLAAPDRSMIAPSAGQPAYGPPATAPSVGAILAPDPFPPRPSRTV